MKDRHHIYAALCGCWTVDTVQTIREWLQLTPHLPSHPQIKALIWVWSVVIGNGLQTYMYYITTRRTKDFVYVQLTVLMPGRLRI